MLDRLSALIKLICYLLFRRGCKKEHVPPGAEKAIHLNYVRNSSGQGQYGQSNALEDLRGGARYSRSCSRSFCCCCCPCRVSSICAMSLNSRSQENAMLRCAGHVHRLTDTVGAAKQSIHRYTAQLLLPVDNRDDSSSNSHSSNLQHRQHRRIPGSFPAANGKHCLIQPAVCPAVVVASLSLPRNRNSPATATATATAPTAARLHLIKVCSRVSYSVSISISVSESESSTCPGCLMI